MSAPAFPGWHTEDVTDPASGVTIPGRSELDHVVMTFESDDGTETKETSFAVDDYAKRLGPDLDAYLSQRALPKLAEQWRPDFREVSRRVDHYAFRDGEWALQPAAAGV